MEVFFVILKTAGVILLVILGSVLLLAALLLFVPVRYRAEGELAEAGGRKAAVRFSWLLSVITVRIEYADGLKMAVRAAGIPIHPERWVRRASGKADPEKKKGSVKMGSVKKEPAKDVPGMKDRDPEAAGLPSPADGAALRDREAAAGKGAGMRDAPRREGGSFCGGGLGQAGNPAGESGRRASGIASKIASWEDRLRGLAAASADALRGIAQMLKGLLENAEGIRENVNYYRGLLTEEESLKTVRLIRTHLIKLLSHVKPGRLSVNLTVGADDPSITGKVLAVNGMLYPWIGEAVCITPDFEKECLYGDFCAKGRIRACVALYHILRVILDRRTWTLIRRLKKEELTNG